MNKDLEIWRFVSERLRRGEAIMLLVVSESTGSSPGRAGYKMAVSSDGELYGSIGGGLMEVNLVEHSRSILSAETGTDNALTAFLKPQVHRKNDSNASGMICSGKQTVVFRQLTNGDAGVVDGIISTLEKGPARQLMISPDTFGLTDRVANSDRHSFELRDKDEFLYTETIGTADELYIIGGGHCALALSEIMSRLGFRVSIIDDRPSLNTIEKNRFAAEISIIEDYQQIEEVVHPGPESFVVVMTLGFASDEVVIRQLIDKPLKYLGVLGSKAKMATLFNALRAGGILAEQIERIHAPVGLPINSRTPEEIAVSIAAEIIQIRNSP